MIKHAQSWSEHLRRKTVVAAVSQTYKTTAGYVLDGYNNQVNTNPEHWSLQSGSYAGRLPGTVIAVRIESSQLVHYMPDIDELMKKVHRTRFCTPVSQYSMTAKTPFAGTGLLTSNEIVRAEGLDEEIRRKMRGF